MADWSRSSPGGGANAWHAPVRICLSGEDLDWLGYRSVCVAIDLPIIASVGEEGAIDGSGLVDVALDAIRARTGQPEWDPPRISLSQQAPAASGLASSTALLMCLLQVLHTDASGSPMPRSTLIELAYETERKCTHGGGMDQLSIARGGVTLTSGNRNGLPAVDGSAPWPGEWGLILVDSGIPKHTPTHIRDVRRQLERGDDRLSRYMADVDDCSIRAWQAIVLGNFAQLCDAVNAAHEAMRDLQGMSTIELEELRSTALGSGCAAVKLTGAGGGGALVALVESDAAPSVLARLHARCSRQRIRAVGVDTVGFRRAALPSGAQP